MAEFHTYASMFLTPDQIADLTGIRKGRHGQTRAQLQCAHLKRIGVPFWVNAAGEPKVARSFFECGRQAEPQRPGWQPAALKTAA